MNVALVIERMHPRRGGRETSVAQIAGELARRGHAVTILCQQGQLEAPGVAVRPLAPPGAPTKGADALLRFSSAVSQAAGEFDVVHATLPLPGATVYQPRGGTLPGQAAARRRRHGLLSNLLATAGNRFNAVRRLRGEYERQLVEDPRCLHLPVSRMVAEEYAHHYGLTDRVKVVYNAVATPDFGDVGRASCREEFRNRHRIDAGDLVFLTAATNFPLKGVPQLMRAFSRWSAESPAGKNAKLVAAGSRDVQRYRALAKRLNAADRIIVEPGLPPEVMSMAFAAADAVALLSWYDPCSRVVLEGVRLGLPGMTTLHNGAGEVLVRHGAGEIVRDPDDERAITDGL
ncbi:MAG: glycosyltransferase family 4 protein, partial [Phycisphaerae bacterium]